MVENNSSHNQETGATPSEQGIAVELAEFTIETSKEDILTKRSAFNPYPERARQGMSVWFQEPDTSTPNISTVIRYTATGETYITYIPIAVPISGTIPPPKPATGEFTPLVSFKTDTRYDWEPFDTYMRHLSEAFVVKELRTSDFTPRVTRAVVQEMQGNGTERVPVFKDPAQAYLSIFQAAQEAIAEGDWRAAVQLVDNGLSVPTYAVEGVEYGETTGATFVYSVRGVAFDVCPRLAAEFSGGGPSFWAQDPVIQLAQNITGLAVTTIKLEALDNARRELTSPATSSHLEVVQAATRDKQSACKRQLRATRDARGVSALDQAMQYFGAHGIKV